MSPSPDGSVGSVRETVGTAGFYNPRDGGISVQLLSQRYTQGLWKSNEAVHSVAVYTPSLAMRIKRQIFLV
jgi:hypothetical protein